MIGYLVAASTMFGLGPWEQFFAGVVLSLVVAKAVQLVMLRGIRRLIDRTDLVWDDILFEELHTPIYTTIAIAGLFLSTYPLRLSPTLHFQVQAVALTLVTIIWAYSIMRMGRRFFEQVEGSSRFDHDFLPIFENLWTFIIILAGAGILLAIWNIDITPLLASAGIMGIAVGFAAKDTVANLFGGIALYFDKTYKVGDYVVLDTGESGTVVDVGVRSTRIRTRDDRIITIPNSVLNNARLINESAPQTSKRISIPIGVAYGTDIDTMEEMVVDIAEEEEMVLDRPSPRMRFKEFGDNALNYDLQCWVDNPLHDVKATHNLLRSIYQAFNEEGIEIPYPQRDVYLRKTEREDIKEVPDAPGDGE